MAQIRQAVLMLILAGTLWKAAGGESPKFFPDDPIQTMPPPLPVKKPARQKIDDNLDFLQQSKRRWPRPPTPAGAINTLGEVPDSEWFTNRHGLHRLTRDELQRGPGSAEPAAPPFTVVSGKNEGITPGFVLKDAKGRRYFAKVDPPDYPELVTGADVIVSKFLYAIGYNTPSNEIAEVKLSDLTLSPAAKITVEGGQKRPMTRRDLEEITTKLAHSRDGSLRIVASLAIPGESIGPFRFEGTRTDDPNDVVPHENRRDLRGLYVFSAWLNNTDAKSGNSLDTVVTENGIRFIRHYLIDFGSALGSDGDRPKDPRFGYEFMLPTTSEALKQILTLGLAPQPWEKVHFPKLPAVGNFESQLFDPDCWKSDYPNPAFLSRLPDDDFWGAKLVMAFTDDDIRAIVETGRFTDPQSTDYMVKTLAERRNKIGRTFFSKVLPLDHFRVENGTLLFDDLAVRYGFHPSRAYNVQWSSFDNITQNHNPIAGAGSSRLPHEVIQAIPGSYFSAVINVSGDPLRSVTVYLHKKEHSYNIVGVDFTW